MKFTIMDPRYEDMNYRRCGKSGLLMSEISLGLWHNFGADADYGNCRSIVEYAFDHGVTCFDLANNYGPPAGSAETTFGKIFKQSLSTHRDEIIVTTKAGHHMWAGPYGEWGSRKNLMASLDQSLKRMGLEYVDIFYSHRPDPDTPIEETMQALTDMVRAGKALYVGISKYPPEMAQKAYDYLKNSHTSCLVYQGRLNMLDRKPEEAILGQAEENGVGFTAFSPLAQGLLSDRYLNGIPQGSRMTHSQFLRPDMLTPELLAQLKEWNATATGMGMTLAQYALKWVLDHRNVASVIVGASSVEQLKSNLSIASDKL